MQLGIHQASPLGLCSRWHLPGYIPLRAADALIGNVAHLTASTTTHFSQRFSPLPLLYTLKSFHFLQFCCATAVAPFEISWPFSQGLKGVANSCFSAGRLLDGSSAASPLPPPQAHWAAECPDPKQLLLDKAMAAPLQLTQYVFWSVSWGTCLPLQHPM